MSQNNNLNPYDAYPNSGPYSQFDNPDLAYRQQGYQQPYPPAYQPMPYQHNSHNATAWATGSLSNY